MSKKSLEIHSENILPIIKKWLYSDHDIFVRELVSNACDAIQKVKILRDKGEVQGPEDEPRVDVTINKEEKTLKFVDNGVGMDAEEVQKYIAQIAFSGAEDFMAKYKSNDEKDQFIGHFGLGFYSAYMVADKVEINTLSYKPGAEPVFWSCDGSAEYIIEKGTKQARGTEITLFINGESEEYLEQARMMHVLKHYCSFLPFPIYLNGQRINTQEPLWVKAPSECQPSDYLDFYHHLYPMEEDPLFWVHLNVDYPFHLKGILYFPKIRRDFDVSKHTVNLYCNRVFVADNCKDVIPNYLMVLRGVIDSPDIPLNVSRSYLQMDRTVRQLASHISKKVSDSLGTLYRNERDKFIASWTDVAPIVKLGVLEDEKFYERVKEFLIWKDTEGNWTTIEEYKERNGDKTKDKVFYTRDEKHGSSFLDVYKQRGVEVLNANSPVDPYLFDFLERKLSPLKFQRIDAGIEEQLIDKDREKTILDESGRTEAARLADFFRNKLQGANLEVEAKSLAADGVPAVIVMDENQRRLRDYMRSLDSQDVGSHLDALSKKTLVINTNNPLIHAIQEMEDKDPDLAAQLVRHTYDLTLLSQREMDAAALNEFVTRSTQVIEHLTRLAKSQKSE